MKNAFTVALGLLIALILLTYMFAFTVRYDQMAVLTTFSKATDPVVDLAGQILEPGSVKRDPGLYFRWPWPVQQVQTYPTRMQILEDQLEELQTADAFSLIVRTFVVWRIDDPLAFFRRLKTIDEAEKQLHSLLRNTKGVISKYRFEQLVNTDASAIQLRPIEQQMLEQLRQRLAEAGYGISVQHVGIRRMMLPEDVTEGVFERMKSTRQRMAQKARTEGEAQAAAIRSEANSASKRILAFAEERALKLRADGDSLAAQYYDVFGKDQDLASFLRRIQTLKAALPGATLIVPADQIAPDGLISPAPGSVAPGSSAPGSQDNGPRK
ncbi:MAG: protease modulator HflC [Phycisphaeraceae bacterium]|nr:protease modulator HflC [Phycisphaeraceae bacterium]